VPTTDSRQLLEAVRDEGQRHGSVDAGAASSRPRTPVFIIASPRPRSGKTFLARLLVEFLSLDGGSVRAFDLGTGSDTLQDYLPGVTLAADIGDVQGQMTLFDRVIIGDTIAKVVDLGSSSYRQFFGLVEEVGLIAEMQRRAVEPIVLFAADQHPATAEAYENLHYRFRDMLVVPVFNEAIALEQVLRERFPVRRAAAMPLRISYLTAELKAQADRQSRCFADFHTELPSDIPSRLAAELRAWTCQAFLEFRELQLRLLLESLRTSLTAVTL
jgi:hypothetical protein